MLNSNACIESCELSKSIYDFLRNVPSANEESLTDYLIWKVREYPSLKFHIVNSQTFTRHEENTIYGADMLLWIKLPMGYLPLLIQAKKFIRHDYDGYKEKLKYKSKKAISSQIDTLINHATKHNYLPRYLIYTQPNPRTKPYICHQSFRYQPLILVDAYKIKKFTIGKKSRLKLNEILNSGHSFCNIFCCDYYKQFKQLPYLLQEVPTYVSKIKIMSESVSAENLTSLDDKGDRLSEQDFIQLEEVEQYELSQVKSLAFIDLSKTSRL